MVKHKVRAIKLNQIVAVQTGPESRQSKSVQYVTATDANWQHWEFNELPHGLEIIPPWKGDRALVPWQVVSYINTVPVPDAVPAKGSKS